MPLQSEELGKHKLSLYQSNLNFCTEAESFDEAQRVDLFVTRQWIRILLWEYTIRRFSMSCRLEDQAFSLLLPITIAHEMLSLFHAVSESSIQLHGYGMVQPVTPGSGHAELDIDQARSLGIEAFALNVGQPDADWARSTIGQLFAHASRSDFKLFFSLDFYQNGDINAYNGILTDFLGHPAYLRAGPYNHPVVSTFSVGQYGPEQFRDWKVNSWGNSIYFIPNADRSVGYNNPPSWFEAWNQAVEGVFGWESAWPESGTSPANVSDAVDIAVQNAAHRNGKTYMAPLSSLQYKDCCGANYYRIGEANLPEKMMQLLNLNPDFVEILTWNDAGESHYIGNNWPEGLTPEMLAYSNNEEWSHRAWQPLIASWIAAYKSNKDSGGMTPPAGSQAIGAMWYRTIPTNAPCAGGRKPDNWQSALDAVNYAVVVAPDSAGIVIRVISAGQVISEKRAAAGLNYGSVPGMRLGSQRIELVNGDSVVQVAAGSKDVVADDSACNFNYQVVELK
ncbi:uncharacterized protein ALTATR162_LOCUS142 [Alternaria atra]|uniref:Glucan endo-1,3-alpha-glucosidase agn1 n=1 Tax=Alternaria atra TaxID=119953 RepID=A0A8J2HTI8_9PLEO|nr:uncharacterized protein ALTATR162_LOCUS142 [Alternaria atra]CAG5137544.1 unnamed protein product [Alternaria atra]